MHTKQKMSRGAKLTIAALAVLAPLTLLAGSTFLQDRQYFWVSLLMLLYAMVLFFTLFESRRPQAGELVLLAVLCAVAVAGRAAFFMLPQFKPMAAVVIVAGACFGGQAGFLTGALSAFVSNFLFGQGPWTPWQMCGFGLLGLLAGLFFAAGPLRVKRLPLSCFGFLATLLIYGPVLNFGTLLMSVPQPTWQLLWLTLAAGLPFDLIHAFASLLFLFLFGAPMAQMLQRVRRKYGLMQAD